MSQVAIEAVKVKLDSTGKEAVYEPSTDMATVAAGTLVETAKIMDENTMTETEIEAGEPASGSSTPTTPSVGTSTVSANDAGKIHVTWSENMKGTGNIKNAIDIIIDGAASVHPSAVTFSGKTMTMTLASPVVSGAEVITWAYDDSNATETLETVTGVEADNQTYSVTNGYQNPNATTFASAEVLPTSGGNWIQVTLSDDKAYASVHTEWFWKKNGGAEQPATAATGHNTNKYHISVGGNGTIVAGDTVTVSHKPADSGIAEFIDQPVTNSLT